jgi:imidazolonepropionase-like amidohydrolase
MKAGVRTIEHGNLVDAESARLMASKGAYMVPNLVAYVVMKERAASYGMTKDMLDKNEHVLKSGYAELEICRQAGVKMGYGSDLLGALENEQSREFLIRREVMAPIEVLRSAMLVGAEIVRQEGRLGVVEPGAFADLLLVDGDPLRDFGLLQDGGAHIPAIMTGGQFHKYTI